MLRRNLHRSALSLALLSLLWSGCAQDRQSPTNPTAALPDGTSAIAFDPATSATIRAGLTDLRQTVQLVNATGGTVVAGRVKVAIPPGALLSNTEITVQEVQTDGLKGILGPHGTTFETPVTLEFDLRGYIIPPTEEWTIYWWDDANGKWVDLNATFSRSAMKVSVPLEHFSTYQPGPKGRAGW